MGMEVGCGGWVDGIALGVWVRQRLCVYDMVVEMDAVDDKQFTIMHGSWKRR